MHKYYKLTTDLTGAWGVTSQRGNIKFASKHWLLWQNKTGDMDTETESLASTFSTSLARKCALSEQLKKSAFSTSATQCHIHYSSSWAICFGICSDNMWNECRKANTRSSSQKVKEMRENTRWNGEGYYRAYNVLDGETRHQPVYSAS